MGTSDSLPSFPSDALPPWLRAFVEAVAVSRQVPMDLPALATLSTLGATVAGKAVVVVRPGYEEALCLWTACVLGSGERKSAVVRDATRPLERIEAALWDVWHSVANEEDEPPLPFLDRYDRLDRVFEEPTPPSFPPFGEVVRTLAAQYDQVAPGVAPQLLVDNITSASFVEILHRQAGRLALLNAEGSVFPNITRNSRGGSSDIDDFLRAHVPEPIRRHRKGQPGIVIRSPALTIGIAPQPSVLRSLRSAPELRGRGLLARFLWAVPTSRMGTRDVAAPGLDPALVAQYEGHVRAMLVLTWPAPVRPGSPRPHALALSADALRVRDAFAHEVEMQLGVGGNLRIISDWANKLPGLVVRIAGVLHLAEHALRGAAAFSLAISGETMTAAAAIGRFAIPHALAAHELVDGNTLEDDATYLLAVLRGTQWHEFTASEVHKRVDGRIRKSEQVARALEHLVAEGVLRLVALSVPTGGRPRGPVYGWP